MFGVVWDSCSQCASFLSSSCGSWVPWCEVFEEWGLFPGMRFLIFLPVSVPEKDVSDLLGPVPRQRVTELYQCLFSKVWSVCVFECLCSWAWSLISYLGFVSRIWNLLPIYLFIYLSCMPICKVSEMFPGLNQRYKVCYEHCILGFGVSEMFGSLC